jgi:glycosyltransferase involved in cell wall biosynthesis
VDNCSDDGTREYLYKQPDVVLYSSDTEYKHSHYGVAWQQAILGNHCLGKWVLLADADELLVYEGCESKNLETLVNEIEHEGCNAATTFMVDMYPFDDLEDADFDKQSPFEAAPWFDNPPLIHWHLGSGMYSNASSYLSALRHRLAEHAQPNSFTSQKYGLIRYQPWVRYSQGLHDASNLTVSSKPTWFAHFKYHSGFKDKVKIEVRRGQHFNNATEYRRYADMLAEGKGKFGKQGASVKCESIGSIANIFTQNK